jgi:hypothetical protein
MLAALHRDHRARAKYFAREGATIRHGHHGPLPAPPKKGTRKTRYLPLGRYFPGATIFKLAL